MNRRLGIAADNSHPCQEALGRNHSELLFALLTLLPGTQPFMSSRLNQMARPHLSGALPAVKTICSSARIPSTSCGWISGRDANCLDRVREDPRAWKLRLT